MIYFGYFPFLNYSFGVEKTNTFIRSRGSLENRTRFKTMIVKIYIRFQTKTAQKPYLYSLYSLYIRFQTKTAQKPYLYSLYRGVPPPPPGIIILEEDPGT